MSQGGPLSVRAQLARMIALAERAEVLCAEQDADPALGRLLLDLGSALHACSAQLLPYLKAGDDTWSREHLLPTLTTQEEAVRSFWEVMTPHISAAVAAGWDLQSDLERLGVRSSHGPQPL